MKKCVVKFKNGYICINADRLEREEGLIFAFDGEKLVGVFDLGFIDTVHLCEQKEST